MRKCFSSTEKQYFHVPHIEARNSRLNKNQFLQSLDTILGRLDSVEPDTQHTMHRFDITFIYFHLFVCSFAVKFELTFKVKSLRKDFRKNTFAPAHLLESRRNVV